MDKNFKGTKEEYLEFRRKANLRNKKHYSKPEVKLKKKLYKKKYDKENKEKISKYGYELRARPEYKKRVKKWREDNEEHLREYRNRDYRKESKRISDKKQYDKNREDPKKVEKERERLKVFRENNPEKVRKSKRKYNSSKKGVYNLNKQNHRRLVLIKERPCDLSNDKIKRIFERDKVCVYCGSSKKLELDHIVSLKLGGNSLFNNFVIACKRCNTSKSGRDVFYWCKLKGIEVPKIVIKLLKEQSRH